MAERFIAYQQVVTPTGQTVFAEVSTRPQVAAPTGATYSQITSGAYTPKEYVTLPSGARVPRAHLEQAQLAARYTPRDKPYYAIDKETGKVSYYTKAEAEAAQRASTITGVTGITRSGQTMGEGMVKPTYDTSEFIQTPTVSHVSETLRSGQTMGEFPVTQVEAQALGEYSESVTFQRPIEVGVALGRRGIEGSHYYQTPENIPTKIGRISRGIAEPSEQITTEYFAAGFAGTSRDYRIDPTTQKPITLGQEATITTVPLREPTPQEMAFGTPVRYGGMEFKPERFMPRDVEVVGVIPEKKELIEREGIQYELTTPTYLEYDIREPTKREKLGMGVFKEVTGKDIQYLETRTRKVEQTIYPAREAKIEYLTEQAMEQISRDPPFKMLPTGQVMFMPNPIAFGAVVGPKDFLGARSMIVALSGGDPKGIQREAIRETIAGTIGVTGEQREFFSYVPQYVMESPMTEIALQFGGGYVGGKILTKVGGWAAPKIIGVGTKVAAVGTKYAPTATNYATGVTTFLGTETSKKVIAGSLITGFSGLAAFETAGTIEQMEAQGVSKADILYTVGKQTGMMIVGGLGFQHGMDLGVKTAADRPKIKDIQYRTEGRTIALGKTKKGPVRITQSDVELKYTLEGPGKKFGQKHILGTGELKATGTGKGKADIETWFKPKEIRTITGKPTGRDYYITRKIEFPDEILYKGIGTGKYENLLIDTQKVKIFKPKIVEHKKIPGAKEFKISEYEYERLLTAQKSSYLGEAYKVKKGRALLSGEKIKTTKIGDVGGKGSSFIEEIKFREIKPTGTIESPFVRERQLTSGESYFTQTWDDILKGTGVSKTTTKITPTYSEISPIKIIKPTKVKTISPLDKLISKIESKRGFVSTKVKYLTEKVPKPKLIKETPSPQIKKRYMQSWSSPEDVEAGWRTVQSTSPIELGAPQGPNIYTSTDEALGAVGIAAIRDIESKAGGRAIGVIPGMLEVKPPIKKQTYTDIYKPKKDITYEPVVKPRPKFEYKQIPIQTTKPTTTGFRTTTPIVTQITRGEQRGGFTHAPFTIDTIIQRQKQPQQTAYKIPQMTETVPRTTTTFVDAPTMITTPSTFIPFIPFAFWLPDGHVPGEKEKRKKLKQRRKYRPSLTAVVFDIKGKQPKGGMLTGFELRPIPRKRKSKKRKRRK